MERVQGFHDLPTEACPNGKPVAPDVSSGLVPIAGQRPHRRVASLKAHGAAYERLRVPSPSDPPFLGRLLASLPPSVASPACPLAAPSPRLGPIRRG